MVNDNYSVIGDEEHYRTNRLIQELGGDSPRNRVLEYLINLQEEIPVSYDHVCNVTLLEREDVERVFENLVKEGVITHHVEGSLYSLNLQNPYVQKLLSLDAKLIMENLARAKEEYSH